MQVLVGLGNPGPQYLLNRHNVGFMAVDAIAYAHGAPTPKQKDQLLQQEVSVGQRRLMLLKPLSYMNRSGHAVAPFTKFYKIPNEHVFVFHDDLDLPLGKIRVKRGGGHGGHNGLKSLDACLGSDYWRVRMGIGHPGHRDLVSDYVLGNFKKPEQEVLIDLLQRVVDALPHLLAGQADAFMTQVALAVD
ncbi:MAG: aminoacyl-tRNA hydrolase [Holosporales bacterium]